MAPAWIPRRRSLIPAETASSVRARLTTEMRAACPPGFCPSVWRDVVGYTVDELKSEQKSVASRLLNLADPLALGRELGAGRVRLLAIITGGHFGIHWFQQLFPVVLPSLKADLGLSDVQVGALSSVRQLINGTMDLPCGILADSLSRHRVPLLASALLSMGVGYSLMGALPVFAWVLIGCGLIGLGTALWHPAAAAALSNSFPERRATALSIHGIGATISDTLTPLFAGFFLVSISLNTFLAVQLVPALITALLIRGGLARQFGPETAPPPLSEHLREMVTLAKNSTFAGITLATGCMQIGRVVVITFLPVYLQEHLNYSPFALGVYIALLHAMGTFSQPILGHLSDRWGRKAVLFPSFMTLAVLFALLRVAAPGIPLALVVSAIGLFFYTLLNITFAAAMDVAGSKLQATSYGLSSLLIQLSTSPAPVVAGWLIGKYGIGSAFLLAGGVTLAGGLLLLPLKLYRGTRLNS
jgi:FSR family fosmidomycin resistance protein-like MFS transporter